MGTTVIQTIVSEKWEKIVKENQQYKQQIDKLEKWLEEEIARLDIELGNTFGVHGIIIKEKYDLRDAYTKVLSKLKEKDVG